MGFVQERCILQPGFKCEVILRSFKRFWAVLAVLTPRPPIPLGTESMW